MASTGRIISSDNGALDARGSTRLRSHGASRLFDWNGRRVTVMGLGRHGGGVAVARYLAEHGAEVTISGRGEELISSVIECVSERRIRVRDFKTMVPTLEDVFLTLTGHSVRQ